MAANTVKEFDCRVELPDGTLIVRDNTPIAAQYRGGDRFCGLCKRYHGIEVPMYDVGILPPGGTSTTAIAMCKDLVWKAYSHMSHCETYERALHVVDSYPEAATRDEYYFSGVRCVAVPQDGRLVYANYKERLYRPIHPMYGKYVCPHIRNAPLPMQGYTVSYNASILAHKLVYADYCRACFDSAWPRITAAKTVDDVNAIVLIDECNCEYMFV